MLVKGDMFKLLGICVVLSREQGEGRALLTSIPLAEVGIGANWAENF